MTALRRRPRSCQSSSLSRDVLARPRPRPFAGGILCDTTAWRTTPMKITATRDRAGKMRHVVAIRNHRIPVDEVAAVGGEDTGPTPHDLYDAALAACKALTMVWYANRKQIPLEDVSVTVERDD